MKTNKSTALVIPARQETELDEANYQLACDLHAKFPQVAIRNREVKEAEGRLAQKYFRLCEALREPGEGMKLNGKEITLLLLGLGYRKQRVTEFRRVIEVADDVWENYKKNVIGFKAVLAIARGSNDGVTVEAETTEATDGGEAETTGDNSKKEAAPKVKALPKDTQTAFADAMAQACEVGTLWETGKGYYEMIYGGDLNIAPMSTAKGGEPVKKRVQITIAVEVKFVE